MKQKKRATPIILLLALALGLFLMAAAWEPGGRQRQGATPTPAAGRGAPARPAALNKSAALDPGEEDVIKATFVCPPSGCDADPGGMVATPETPGYPPVETQVMPPYPIN
jgi:hypothetical protein